MTTIQVFDFSLDLFQALLWQYNEAERLQSLLQGKQNWYDATQESFWSDWITNVFDLRTANDFGLSVWAILLDMPLTIVSVDATTKPIWGFGPNRVNFGNGNFKPWLSLPLTTEQTRLVLRLRYFQLVTRGTIPEINVFLAYLFKDLGPAFVLDGLNMTMRYVFGFPLSQELQQVFSSFDVLPRPAGVFVDYIVLPEVDGWGFGRYHYNFENGNFHHA